MQPLFYLFNKNYKPELVYKMSAYRTENTRLIKIIMIIGLFISNLATIYGHFLFPKLS